MSLIRFPIKLRLSALLAILNQYGTKVHF
jgi:hypothetical protein